MRHGNDFGKVINDYIKVKYSDPTYEAWKLALYIPGIICLCNNSDPTYEAWKPGCLNIHLTACFTIPILPMRHGNYALIP